MKVALVQMDLAFGRPDRNATKAVGMVREARAQGADLALLPELWTTAYDLESAAAHAVRMREGERSPAAQIAQESGLFVCGSELEADGEDVFNAQTIHSPAGEVVASYRKIHLFGLMDEPKYLGAGSQPVVADIAGLRVGLAVCYDLRFPELFRRYALDGADLVLVSAEWPEPRLDHWRTLVRSRAIENQCYVAACNRVGETKGTRFFGHSMIVDPWGEVRVECLDAEGVVTASIDAGRLAEVRQQYPFLNDRRNGVYALP